MMMNSGPGGGVVDLDAVLKLVAVVSDPPATKKRLGEIKAATEEWAEAIATAEKRKREADERELEVGKVIDAARESAVQMTEAAQKRLTEVEGREAAIEAREATVIKREAQVADLEARETALARERQAFDALRAQTVAALQDERT